MPARLENLVALVTGAARGQGRSHAVRLAQEGADIIAVDLCANIESVPYALASSEDLAETVKQVEALDRRIVAVEADVRDYGALKAAVDAGVSQLGRLDVVVANAGIVSHGEAPSLDEQEWHDVLDVNLTGVWHAAKVAIPHIRAGGRGGSLILTGSAAGLHGIPNIAHYVSAKHGVVGLTKALALELGPDMIRVNCVHPTNVDTDMIHNDATRALIVPEGGPDATEKLKERLAAMNAMPIPWIEPVDVSNVVLFLASDEARYITGASLPIDAGAVAG